MNYALALLGDMEPAYQNAKDAFIISSKSPGTLNFYEEGKKLASEGKYQEALFLYQVGLHSDRQRYGEESKESASGYYNVAILCGGLENTRRPRFYSRRQ